LGHGAGVSTKQLQKAIAWAPYLLAVGIAFLVVPAFRQARTDWHEWKQYKQGPIRFADMRPGTLVWKQPVLPAQYAQGSCGACHREDLPETPRLNHGRQLIVKFNCIACHQLQDIDRPAMLGPDLTNVGTKVTREWIYKWLKDPRTLTDADGNVTVDGVDTDPRMPKFQLNDQELRALSAYLSVQRAKPVAPYRFDPRVVAIVAKGGDAADQGKIRFDQMFCVTCHPLAVDRGGETTLIGGGIIAPGIIVPELTKVGSKVKPEWLMAWLRDPQSYLQHTRMPQFQWTDKDMYEITQYILKRLTDPDLLNDVPQLGPPTDAEVHLGQRLFVEKGCAECHAIQGVTPRGDFGPDLSALGMAAGPYLIDLNSARKPSVPLHFVKSNVERLNIIVSVVPRFMIAYIQAKITNPSLDSPETHMPQFHMSQPDLDDITTALLSMIGSPITSNTQNPLIIPRPHPEFHPDGRFGQLYQRFKCYDCHAFNGYGGTLAPDLSYEGSRSQREWLVQFLRNPQTLRPTLTVRMPDFNMSEQDATTLANYLSAALQNPHVNPEAMDEKEFTPQMAEHGKQLYEVKYACQSCHTIGSSGGYVGPSLNNAGNWLTSAWIEAWLHDPQALVPGTIEPQRSFTENEIRDITAYLLTLKQIPAAKSAAPAAAVGGGQ
jgi:mono/diheme cytochrome c family protein